MNETEAARFLGVSRRTVQGWRLAGKGPRYHQISGRCVRYSLPLLEEFLQGTVRASTSDHGQGR
ncbi:MAG TPA: helix-turn-helix domain-containing protein [bacterium]|nr:helix-turn-helix domain-containing protein [bacterium]